MDNPQGRKDVAVYFCTIRFPRCSLRSLSVQAAVAAQSGEAATKPRVSFILS